MKPLRLHIQESPAASFHIRQEQVPFFDNPWHYHPELELTLVTKSTGIRFVGDSIESFGPGDLVLLGANLPHYWRNDDVYYQATTQPQAEALILRFRLNTWGATLLESPEMVAIRRLFQRAATGICFSAEMAVVIQPLLEQLLRSHGIDRLVGWLQVFSTLANSDQYRLLSQKTFGGQHPTEDSDRMSQVLAYVHENLTKPITLAGVAAIASMNSAAFCRYFRQQTNKTFVAMLTELRINYACRLLLDTGKDVGEVCFDSGFRNVPYFNQVFKAHTGVSPTVFRKQQA